MSLPYTPPLRRGREIPRWTLLLATLIAGCMTNEEDGPPEPPDTAPPTVLEVTLTLDSLLKQGTLRIVAADVDGPVSIFCDPPFEGSTFDSFVVTLPYATLRFYEQPILRTKCLLDQGRVALERHANSTVPYAMDTLPGITRDPPPPFHAGVPTAWPHTLTDDWALATLQVFVAPDTGGPCALPPFPQDTMAIGGRQKDTTLVLTIPSTGPYCVVVGAKDDVGHQVIRGEVVRVLP